MVYVTGVHTRFQGAKNPRRPDESFAQSMFAILDDLAQSKAGSVGMCLWVRADNVRAIRFYQKVGFVADPGGHVQRDEGAPHLTMRKLLT